MDDTVDVWTALGWQPGNESGVRAQLLRSQHLTGIRMG